MVNLNPYSKEKLLSAAYEGLKANGYIVGNINKPEIIDPLVALSVLPPKVYATDWYGQFKTQKVVDTEYHGRGIAQTVYVRVHLTELSGGPTLVSYEESHTRFSNSIF